ncbi:hypothetical protein AB0J52_06725 [Spirillospora sp. NPDC049652]
MFLGLLGTPRFAQQDEDIPGARLADPQIVTILTGDDTDTAARVAARLTSPHRDQGVLVVTQRVVDRLYDTALSLWPGLATLLVADPPFLALLNQHLPAARAVPAQGGRWFAPADCGFSDQTFTGAQLARSTVLGGLIDRLLAARARQDPPELVTAAAALLEPGTSLPVPRADTPIAELLERTRLLEAELADTRQQAEQAAQAHHRRLNALEQQLTSARQRAQRAEEHAALVVADRDRYRELADSLTGNWTSPTTNSTRRPPVPTRPAPNATP